MVRGGAGPSRLPPTAAVGGHPGLRRAAITVAGFSVLLLGMALFVVPIPGTSVVVIPLGLTILAREFAWARRLRDWLTSIFERTCSWTAAKVRSLFGARPLVSATAHRV